MKEMKKNISKSLNAPRKPKAETKTAKKCAQQPNQENNPLVNIYNIAKQLGSQSIVVNADGSMNISVD